MRKVSLKMGGEEEEEEEEETCLPTNSH